MRTLRWHRRDVHRRIRPKLRVRQGFVRVEVSFWPFTGRRGPKRVLGGAHLFRYCSASRYQRRSRPTIGVGAMASFSFLWSSSSVSDPSFRLDRFGSWLWRLKWLAMGRTVGLEGFSRGNGRVFWGLGGSESVGARVTKGRSLCLSDVDLRDAGESESAAEISG